MYICHCRAVTDKSIRAALDDGARNPSEIARRCGAGTGCGGCLPALQTMLSSLDSGHERDRAGAAEHAA